MQQKLFLAWSEAGSANILEGNSRLFQAKWVHLEKLVQWCFSIWLIRSCCCKLSHLSYPSLSESEAWAPNTNHTSHSMGHNLRCYIRILSTGKQRHWSLFHVLMEDKKGLKQCRQSSCWLEEFQCCIPPGSRPWQASAVTPLIHTPAQSDSLKIAVRPISH